MMTIHTYMLYYSVLTVHELHYTTVSCGSVDSIAEEDCEIQLPLGAYFDQLDV